MIIEKTINHEFDLQKGDKVVIKVGSNILRGDDNGVNKKNLQNIVDGIAYLMNIGLNVILVSSGAVAVGKSIMNKKGLDYNGSLSTEEKAYLASIGQVELIKLYAQLCQEKGIIISQGLLIHTNIGGEHLGKVLEQNFKNKTLAIINENDVVSGEELGFSDNDELAGLVAIMTQAQVLMLISDIDGIYKNFNMSNQKLIETVQLSDIPSLNNEVIENSSESAGSGGAKSKLNVMQRIMQEKIIGIIANGNTSGIIQNVFSGGDCNKTVFYQRV